MKIFITGISGTGKSELVKEFNKKGITAFDIDEGLCSWVNKKTGKTENYFPGIGEEWIKNHSRICDKLKLKNLLNEKQDSLIVIAGRSSNQKEYLDLFNKIFLLQCDERIFLHRLNMRNENYFGKNKSEQEILLRSYKDFERKMIERGAIPINSEKPVNEVIDEIFSKINFIL